MNIRNPQLLQPVRIDSGPPEASSHRFLLFILFSLCLHCLLLALIPGLNQSGTGAIPAVRLQVYLALNRAAQKTTGHERPLSAIEPGSPVKAIKHPVETVPTKHLNVLNHPTRPAEKPEASAPSRLDSALQYHSLKRVQNEPKTTDQSVKQHSHRMLRSQPDAAATLSPPIRGISQGKTHATPDPSAVAALLRHALLQHFRYPAIARQNSWEGKVVLNVQVMADGQVGATHILQASGFRILDRAAQRAANDIGQLPAARPLLAGQNLTFRVPVAYRLQH